MNFSDIAVYDAELSGGEGYGKRGRLLEHVNEYRHSGASVLEMETSILSSHAREY